MSYRDQTGQLHTDEPVTPELIQRFESELPSRINPFLHTEDGGIVLHRRVPADMRDALLMTDNVSFNLNDANNLSEDGSMIDLYTSINADAAGSGSPHVSRRAFLENPNSRVVYGENEIHGEDIRPYADQKLTERMDAVATAQTYDRVRPDDPEYLRARAAVRRLKANLGNEYDIQTVKF